MRGLPEAAGFFQKPLGDMWRIGPSTQKLLNHLGLTTTRDLIWHLPVRVENFPLLPLASAHHDQACTLQVRVCHTNLTRKMLRVVVQDVNSPQVNFCQANAPPHTIQIVFFKGRLKELERVFAVSKGWFFSGTLCLLDGVVSMVHPVRWGRLDQTPPSSFNVIYPLTKGLNSSTLQRVVQSRLRDIPSVPEWLPPKIREAEAWPTFTQALTTLHSPRCEDDLSPHTPAKNRLAFDELLAHQLRVLMGRFNREHKRASPLQGTGALQSQVLHAAGFTLTPAQERALTEIQLDLASPMPMARLLQGDVGSGKTIVALLALAQAVEAGFQGVFVAPTELLAHQQGEKAQHLFEGTGVRVALLTRTTLKKKALLGKIAMGEVDIVIGTHAVFQESVTFAKLGLVIVDEQHRFGVAQRVQLNQKGQAPHVLVMSATPIPRTLEMTLFADLKLSTLDAKPMGRQPIDTLVMAQSRLEEVKDFVAQKVAQGAQVYWVCPLIEAPDDPGQSPPRGTCVTDRFHDLKARFHERVGLVHGQQKTSERHASLNAFRMKESHILVSTTVIEVGMDVPNATVMVIESAHLFGLAQLHQLRGRVGRGSEKSFCFLMYGYPLSDIGKKRLQALKQSNDGFWIAEQDWKLRGAGDLLGVRQSGLPLFTFANLEVHRDLLTRAHHLACDLLTHDPRLTHETSGPLRLLLSLFTHTTNGVGCIPEDWLSSA